MPDAAPGRVTEVLLERLPAGRVVALDGSASMLERARTRLERFGDRVDVRARGPRRTAAARGAGRRDPVDRDVPLGARPRRAVRNLAAVVRPADGSPRSAAARGTSPWWRRSASSAPIRSAGRSSRRPRRPRSGSHAAGFVDVECWLHDEPTPFDDLEALETFLRTVALGDHVAAMTQDEARAFAHEVAVRLPETALDYVG